MANMNLHPYVKKQAEKLMENANKRLTGDWKMMITQGLRTMEEQAAIYGQGRSSYIYNGKQYGKPKMNIVSGAKPGQSMHNWGLAIDFALKNTKTGAVSWSMTMDSDKDRKADWKEVVEEAKKLGFEWGGDWKNFFDGPHFEINFGLDWRDLQAGKKPPTLAEIEGGKAKPAPSSSSTVLEKGSRGEDVKELQTYLNYLGFDCGKVDGIFGADTEKAVKEFQKAQKLTVDGYAGKNTLSSLSRAYAAKKLKNLYSRPLKLDKQYMKGEDVKVVQQKLGITADGIYGPKSEKAVKDFQGANKLGIDGVVGPKTWAKLF
ncbi:peptidoglycan-binding protein [Fictibacillus fluitans]|uniref:Peptidoglycan-binding protein n=1 Tax=Fictibacillus fluitans TaxID=3058422 RepID=A0ABT8HX02_9BACL|nr:peptidoglycan-binding protein [Fictibacillus sp. NE201]MDN4525310.1 peptidoglycan-binding protein [Fictibacillus sp. NE201]